MESYFQKMADKHKVTDNRILLLENGLRPQSHILWNLTFRKWPKTQSYRLGNLTFRKWPTNTKSQTGESYFQKMADKHKVTDCGILLLGNGRQTQSHMLWNLTFRKWPTNTKSQTGESYFQKISRICNICHFSTQKYYFLYMQ